jgi:hypothetical protein
MMNEADQKQIIFDDLKSKLDAKFMQIASTRLRKETLPGWQAAYNQRGVGSGRTRSSIIAYEVYETAAPVPTARPSVDQNEFFHEVLSAVREVARECGVDVR